MNPGNQGRNILLVSYHFPPDASSDSLRPAAIAAQLVWHGWNVSVVCCAPDGTVRRDEQWAQWLSEMGVTIVRTNPLKRYAALPDGSVNTSPRLFERSRKWLKQWSNQPDVYIGWKREARRAIAQIMEEQRVNIICACSPPFTNFVVAQSVAAECSIPFAVDYGDVWIDNPSHIYPTPMHRSSSLIAEEQVLKQAAMIFAPSRRTKEDFLRRYRFLKHEDIFILPHGFNEAESTAASESTVQTASNHADLNLGQTGGDKCLLTAFQDFHRTISPKPMLAALRVLCASRQDIREQLRLTIYGLMRPSHRKLISKWNLSDVVNVLDSFDRADALQAMKKSDALWLCARIDTPAGSAELGSYLSARKPILFSSDAPVLTALVQESKAAFLSPYKKVKLIAKTLEELFDKWKNGELPKPSAEFVQRAELSQYAKEVSRILGMSMKI